MKSKEGKDTALGMYSARTAARVARVRPQTFQAWIKADLIRPRKFASGKRSENTYTYDDLLLMRLIVRLKEQGAKTKSIRAALATVEYMCEGNRTAWKQVEMSVSSDKDTGIPSQAYVGQYAQAGLTIVLLRWKTLTYRDFQKMTEMVLRDGEKWMEIASHTPSIISVSRRGSRPRAWSQVPPNFR